MNSCIFYDFSWKTNFIKFINNHCFGCDACCCSHRLHYNGNKLMSYKLKIAKVLVTAEKIYLLSIFTIGLYNKIYLYFLC